MVVCGGALHAGLTLNGAYGVFSGIPTVNGTYPVVIVVTDKNGLTGSTTVTFTVSTVGITSGTTAAAAIQNFNLSYQIVAAARRHSLHLQRRERECRLA